MLISHDNDDNNNFYFHEIKKSSSLIEATTKGNHHANLGEHEKAIKYYTIAINLAKALDFNPAYLYEKRSNAYFAVHQYEKGVEDYQATKTCPTHSTSTHYLPSKKMAENAFKRGHLFFEQGEYTKAKEKLLEGMQFDTDGNALEKTEQKQKVMHTLLDCYCHLNLMTKRTIKKGRENTLALIEKLIKLKKYDRAINAINHYILDNPFAGCIYANRAYLRSESNNIDTAHAIDDITIAIWLRISGIDTLPSYKLHDLYGKRRNDRLLNDRLDEAFNDHRLALSHCENAQDAFLLRIELSDCFFKIGEKRAKQQHYLDALFYFKESHKLLPEQKKLDRIASLPTLSQPTKTISKPRPRLQIPTRDTPSPHPDYFFEAIESPIPCIDILKPEFTDIKTVTSQKEAPPLSPITFVVLPKPVIDCMNTLEKFGAKDNFVVGGFLLRNLLKIANSEYDIDIVTPALPETVKQAFGIEPCPHQPRLFQLTIDDNQIDIYCSPHLANSALPNRLLADAKSRDFSCNTLYANRHGEVFDVTEKSYSNIKRGIINTVVRTADSFEEDPTRIFRAIYCANKLGFRLSQSILSAIPEQVNLLINKVTPMKVNACLLKLFSSQHGEHNLQALMDLGIFSALFPELEKHLASIKDQLIRTVQIASITTKPRLRWIYEQFLFSISPAERTELVHLNRLFGACFTSFTHSKVSSNASTLYAPQKPENLCYNAVPCLERKSHP